MHPLVLGTAGHIDHGKTSLVKALTGIDTDRLKEEKERGITIELGFAHLILQSGDTVALVDVPGHERFVRTMVAGAVGMDAVLLVVAADEGVMPQTREHLDICALLGIRAGVVALTKLDLLGSDAELQAVAELELREALRGSFLQNAPIVPCSVRSGVGLEALRDALGNVLHSLPARDADGLVRLPIDRVFALRGFGTVVTGTLWSGSIAVGDDLSALPAVGTSSEHMKVRGLHVHGQPVPKAQAGQRVAVNLAIARDALDRGQVLVKPSSIQPSCICEVDLRYLDAARGPLKRRSSLLLHSATTQRLCRVTLLDHAELPPGGRGLAQLRVPRDQPLVWLAGDRFVLRGFAPQNNHGTTVAGGQVLRVVGRGLQVTRASTQTAAGVTGSDPAWLSLQARSRALQQLDAAQDPSQRLAAIHKLTALTLADWGPHGCSRSDLHGLVPGPQSVLRQALDALVQAGDAVWCQATREGDATPATDAESLAIDRRVLDQLGDLALACVRTFHERDPSASGMSVETLRSQLQRKARTARPAVLQHVLQHLVQRGRLSLAGNQIHIASRAAIASEGGSPLAQQIVQVYQQAGLAPPRVDELLPLLPSAVLPVTAAGTAVSKAVDALCRSGVLVRIKDLIFLRTHLDALRGRLVDFLQQHREIAPPAWKDMVGQSRKFAIPLAEYFDAEKVTLRVGDLRRLRTPATGPAR